MTLISKGFYFSVWGVGGVQAHTGQSTTLVSQFSPASLWDLGRTTCSQSPLLSEPRSQPHRLVFLELGQCTAGSCVLCAHTKAEADGLFVEKT